MLNIGPKCFSCNVNDIKRTIEFKTIFLTIIILLNKDYDQDKIYYNDGTKRICENCNQECLATLYFEFAFKIITSEFFSNCSCGNNSIVNLIQNIQNAKKADMRLLYINELCLEWDSKK